MAARFTSNARRLLLTLTAVTILTGAGATVAEASAWTPYDTTNCSEVWSRYAKRVVCQRDAEWYADGYYLKYRKVTFHDC